LFAQLNLAGTSLFSADFIVALPNIPYASLQNKVVASNGGFSSSSNQVLGNFHTADLDFPLCNPN